MTLARPSDTVFGVGRGLVVALLSALAQPVAATYMVADPTLAISADGRHLYRTRSFELEAYRIDRDAGTPEAFDVVQMEPRAMLGALAISEDGRHLYAVSWHSRIVVFEREAATGAVAVRDPQVDLGAFEENLRGTIAVTVSPDGRFVYAVGHDGRGIVVFERNRRTGRLKPSSAFTTDASGPTDLRVTPDGARVIVSARAPALLVLRRDGASGAVSDPVRVREPSEGWESWAVLPLRRAAVVGFEIYPRGVRSSAGHGSTVAAHRSGVATA